MSTRMQTAVNAATESRIRTDRLTRDRGTSFSPHVDTERWSTHSLAEEPKAATEVAVLPFESVYPFPQLLSPQIRAAHELLRNANKHLTDAIAAHQDGNLIAADDHTMHVIQALRELFCLREIGDGFGAVANAALCGLTNLRGVPATIRQLTVTRRRLEVIQAKPFLSIDDAIPEVDALEDAGLDTEPPGFQVLADWLNGGE